MPAYIFNQICHSSPAPTRRLRMVCQKRCQDEYHVTLWSNSESFLLSVQNQDQDQKFKNSIQLFQVFNVETWTRDWRQPVMWSKVKFLITGWNRVLTMIAKCTQNKIWLFALFFFSKKKHQLMDPIRSYLFIWEVHFNSFPEYKEWRVFIGGSLESP